MLLAHNWVATTTSICCKPSFQFRQVRALNIIVCMSRIQPYLYLILLYYVSFWSFQGSLSKTYCFFGKINVHANHFWTKKGRKKRYEPSYSPRRFAYIGMRFDPERSIWKFDLRSSQMTWPDEWPRQVISHVSWCVITRQTQWYFVQGSNSILWGVINVNVSVTCDDVKWWCHMTCLGVTGLTLRLIHCRIAFEPSRVARFIKDIQKQVERFKTARICITWVVTWPWKPGHISLTNSYRNLPLADYA